MNINKNKNMNNGEFINYSHLVFFVFANFGKCFIIHFITKFMLGANMPLIQSTIVVSVCYINVYRVDYTFVSSKKTFFTDFFTPISFSTRLHVYHLLVLPLQWYATFIIIFRLSRQQLLVTVFLLSEFMFTPCYLSWSKTLGFTNG